MTEGLLNSQKIIYNGTKHSYESFKKVGGDIKTVNQYLRRLIMKSRIFLAIFFIFGLLFFGCSGDGLTREDPIREPPPSNLIGGDDPIRDFTPGNIYEIINKEIIVTTIAAGESFTLVNEDNDYFIIRRIFGFYNPVVGEIKYRVIFRSEHDIEFSERISISDTIDIYIPHETFEISCRGNIEIFLNGVKVEIDYGDSLQGGNNPIRDLTPGNIYDFINKEIVLFDNTAGQSLTLVYEDNDYFIIRKIFGSNASVMGDIKYKVIFRGEYALEFSEIISSTLDNPYTTHEEFVIFGRSSNTAIYLNGVSVVADYNGDI